MKKIIILLVIVFVISVIAFLFLNFSSNKNQVLSPINLPNQVLMPSQEDIIRTFFSLINEKRIPEAVGMLSPTVVPDDTVKQAWGVQFNNLKQVEVMDIKKQADLEGEGEIYRVNLQVEVASETASAPIPYYGWSNGQNVRWISVVKENDLWKIMGIATGP
jgi:hypothetical protein